MENPFVDPRYKLLGMSRRPPAHRENMIDVVMRDAREHGVTIYEGMRGIGHGFIAAAAASKWRGEMSTWGITIDTLREVMEIDHVDFTATFKFCGKCVDGGYWAFDKARLAAFSQESLNERLKWMPPLGDVRIPAAYYTALLSPRYAELVGGWRGAAALFAVLAMLAMLVFGGPGALALLLVPATGGKCVMVPGELNHWYYLVAGCTVKEDAGRPLRLVVERGVVLVVLLAQLAVVGLSRLRAEATFPQSGAFFRHVPASVWELFTLRAVHSAASCVTLVGQLVAMCVTGGMTVASGFASDALWSLVDTWHAPEPAVCASIALFSIWCGWFLFGYCLCTSRLALRVVGVAAVHAFVGWVAPGGGVASAVLGVLAVLVLALLLSLLLDSLSMLNSLFWPGSPYLPAFSKLRAWEKLSFLACNLALVVTIAAFQPFLVFSDFKEVRAMRVELAKGAMEGVARGWWNTDLVFWGWSSMYKDAKSSR